MVISLVVVLLVIVALLGVLVAGLLRSHADIIRSLHSLGVGVGDPAATPGAEHPDAGGRTVSIQPRQARASGPPLPAERSQGVHDLEGETPEGEAIVVSATSADLTLLAFVTTGCDSCARLWASLTDPAQRSTLPERTRIVVVTKGPEWESPSAVASRSPGGVKVVMSTAAWSDYEVPGSPYFVLLDGKRRIRIGEGVGYDLAQVGGLVARAGTDEVAPAGSHSAAFALGLNGAEREAHNDDLLRGAGITPGHPSLYPKSLDDVFAPAGSDAAPDRGA